MRQDQRGRGLRGVDLAEAIADLRHVRFGGVRAGDRLRLNIRYSDQVVHLHEQHFVVNGERIEAIWATLARGRSQ